MNENELRIFNLTHIYDMINMLMEVDGQRDQAFNEYVELEGTGASVGQGMQCTVILECS